METLARPQSLLAGLDDLLVSQASELPPLFLISGQSNATPYRDWAESDLGLRLQDMFSGAYITQWYGDAPPAWTHQNARRNLQPGAPSGQANMGLELSFGRLLNRRAGATVELMQWARSGEPLTTFTTPLYRDQLISDIRSVEAATGTALRVVVWLQGETDAMDSTNANAYLTRFQNDFVAPLRAEFGPGLIFIIARLNDNSGAPNPAVNSPYLSTVQAAQDAFVAGDAFARIVRVDDLPMLDAFHYRACELTSMGNRLASATADMLGYPPTPVTGATPICLGSDTGVYGAGALVVRSLPDLVPGDLEILVVSTNYLAAAISIPDLKGFTLVQSDTSIASSGTINANAAIYARTVTQTVLDANGGRMPTVTIADTNDKNAAKIFAFRSPTGTAAVRQSAKAKTNASVATMSCPALVGALKDSLIFNLVTGWAGSSSRTLSNITNASLSSLAAHQHSVFAVAAEGVVISSITGVVPAAGNVSATTGTWNLNVTQNTFTVEIQAA